MTTARRRRRTVSSAIDTNAGDTPAPRSPLDTAVRMVLHLFAVRYPDLIIGPANNPQTKRWHLLRWRGIQVSLHRWCRSDDDRALHDHSGDSISILLSGCYRDLVRTKWQAGRFYSWRDDEWYRDIWHTRLPFIPYYRPAAQPHRVALINGRSVWSIWIRFKPFREWGFHCPRGWKHWKDYTNTRDYSSSGSVSEIGPGCG